MQHLRISYTANLRLNNKSIRFMLSISQNTIKLMEMKLCQYKTKLHLLKTKLHPPKMRLHPQKMRLHLMKMKPHPQEMKLVQTIPMKQVAMRQPQLETRQLQLVMKLHLLTRQHRQVMRQPPQEPMTLHLKTGATRLLRQMGIQKYLQQMTPNHLMVAVGEGDLDLESDTLLKNSSNTYYFT